jgi:hypothetical protein
MSETQITKPISAHIKVSSLDAHKIISPQPREAAKGGKGGAAPAQRRAGRMQPTSDNVIIGRQPQLAHVTSSSSSQKSEIKTAPPMPPALAKKIHERQLLANTQQVSDHLPDYTEPKKPIVGTKPAQVAKPSDTKK